MIFNFKQSELVIDCFTSNDVVYHNFKIDRARAFIPTEWKELPVKQSYKLTDNPKSKATIESPNLKLCLGFTVRTQPFHQTFFCRIWCVGTFFN